MQEQILNQLNLFIWAKDKNFKYIYCNENYAKAAGLDSPNQIVGKSDDALPWCEQADYFRTGDYGVFQGKIRLNVPETEVRPNGIADILVSENQLLNNTGKCIGLVGSYIDITGQRLVKKVGYYDEAHQRYYLGNELNNTYLTQREIEVFKRILLGYTAQQTASIIGLSAKTVESHIENIKIKLQAKSKGEIIATAIQYGLTQILYLQRNLPKQTT